MNSIKYYREKSGLLQDELAKLMNVSQGAVSQWETGDAFPSTEKLMNLAVILNCNIDELLNGTPIYETDTA